MTLEREIQECDDCRVLTDDGEAYPDERIWNLKNGMTLGLPGVGVIPLWSDFLLCEPHAARAAREWQ